MPGGPTIPSTGRPVDDVAFEYRLRPGWGGAGWADARLEVGGNAVEMGPSYVTDALGDLLRAVLALTQGAADVSVSWDEEGTWVVWRFALDAGNVRLHVDVRGQDGPAAERQLSGVVRRDALVRVVAREARAVLDEHGEEGYLRRWSDEYPFPTAELRALDAWRAQDP